MQPKLCTKCKKNVAVIFITKIENGASLNEGYCLKCARSLGIPQIDQAVKQMGISEEDLDALSDEMGNVFGQTDIGEEEDPDSRTATFPLLNQFLGGNLPARQPKALPPPRASWHTPSHRPRRGPVDERYQCIRLCVPKERRQAHPLRQSTRKQGRAALGRR